MSDANRVQVIIVEENTLNVFPGGAMTPVRITDESLVPEVQNISSEELRSDRMVTDIVQVSRQNSGGFGYEFSYGTFDDLIEGAMFSTWITNVIKNGVLRKSYSMQKAMLDIDKYFLFTGMVINSWTLNLATGAIANGSFDFLGCNATVQNSAFTATINSSSSTSVMSAMANVASLQEAAYGATMSSLIDTYVQELSFTVANNLRPINAIGSDSILNIGVGKQDVTGTMTVHFTNMRLYDKFLAGDALALSFTLESAGIHICLNFLKSNL
jgi:hypothetical protein